MRIVIVGGGKTGAYLAGELKKEHTVTLLEQREERVIWLRSALPDIEIIEGDACEPLVLEGAGAPAADLVVAVTGDDEDNLVVAMLAKVLSDTTKVYARVNHPRNQWLFDKEWGVDVAVSSPAVLYGLIGKDLGLGDIVTLLNLQDEDMSLREIRLPENAKACGLTLADIALPSNVTVMAILAAGGGVRAARGDTLLGGGDQLLLLFEGDIDQQAIRDALGVTEEVCTDEDDAAAH